jgi:hypothetical protein
MLLRGSCDSCRFLLACVRREGAPGPRQPTSQPTASETPLNNSRQDSDVPDALYTAVLDSPRSFQFPRPGLDDYSLTSWMINTWSTLQLSPLRVTYLRCRCWTPQVSHASFGREISTGRRDTMVGTRKQLTRWNPRAQKICGHVQIVKNWSMISLSMEAPLHGHWSIYQEFRCSGN